MQEHIKEGKVLEFKALTMSKRIFDQVRSVVGVGAEETRIIGWVQDGYMEWYIGQLGTQIVKVTRPEMFVRIVQEIGREEINNRAHLAKIGPGAQTNIEVDKLRDSLPQIFLK